ncbi:hypothetical protein [Streptomyces sp. NBC_00035]|uniref:hypothetical protein n=1 Tax=Streptomyces sp. NBC_00035 TaxID=2903614 RepID=UPI00324EA9A7
MGWIAIAFHWTMIVCTVGLWTPFFLAARRRRLTVTHIPQGYPPQQYAQQPPYGQQQYPPHQ